MSDRPGQSAVHVGTRGSALALAQTQRVIAKLSLVHPELAFLPTVIKTEGDLDKTSPLTEIGGRGVFTAGVQEALADGRVDIAVHSAKDLPPREPRGLVLAAFPEREDPRDVLVSRHGVGLADLPACPRIGTSSRRRALQVRLARPDAEIVELRGNIDTRLRKATGDDLDAIVLAAAGIVRIGRSHQATEWLPLDRFLPAPGQGALAVEARTEDRRMRALLAAIDNPCVSTALMAERAFLDALGAGCTTPLGAHVHEKDGRWTFRAMLGDDVGERVEWIEVPIDPAAPEQAAVLAAAELLGRFGQKRPWAEGSAASGLVNDGVIAGQRQAAERTNGNFDFEVDRDRDPLDGLRVVVTRPREQAGSLVDALRRRGAEPIELPTIRIVPARDRIHLTGALLTAVDGGHDWIAFTSVNAVRASAEALRGAGRAGLGAGRVRIAVVGGRTADAVTDQGGRVDIVADPATAEGLVGRMVESGIVGKRILYPHGDLASDVLPRRLIEAGAVVDAVEAYRTEWETEQRSDAVAAITTGNVDIVTFASPSSIRAMLAVLAGSVDGLASARVVCIGPVTANAARALGVRVDAVADDASLDGILSAVTDQSRSIGRRRERSAAH